MTTLSEVVEFIYGSSTEDDREAIYQALRGASREKRAQETAIASASFKVGDKVQLAGLSPQYVNGTRGEIIERKNTKFVVKFEDPVDSRVRQRFGSSVRVPATGLRKVDAT